jgi:hypothetical protein
MLESREIGALIRVSKQAYRDHKNALQNIFVSLCQHTEQRPVVLTGLLHPLVRYGAMKRCGLRQILSEEALRLLPPRDAGNPRAATDPLMQEGIALCRQAIFWRRSALL